MSCVMRDPANRIVKSGCGPGKTWLIDTIAKTGFFAHADLLSPEETERVVTGAGDADDHRNRAAYVLFVRSDIEQLGQEGRFWFARCGLDAALYDANERRIRKTYQTARDKGGHPKEGDAASKACERPKSDLSTWVEDQLTAIASEEPRSSSTVSEKK